MKHTTNKLKTAFYSFFRNRLNVFYVLAFAPLLLMMYYYIKWPFPVVIPLYGFLLLLIKKHKLSLCHEAGSIQKAFGLLFVLGSFFVYYALVSFFPYMAFYGPANYVIYILGLFLTFFNIHALREAFTPIFLIVATTSSSFVSNWLEPYLTPYIPHYVSLIAAILRTLGIWVTTRGQFITLHTVKGTLPMVFVWACVGATSMLIFSIILVVTLFEESASLKTKLVWGFIGVIGTFIMNVVRLTIIFLADYFYGFEVGGKIHYVIGYILFIAWLAIFFYIFSKRQVISEKFKLIWQKLRSSASLPVVFA